VKEGIVKVDADQQPDTDQKATKATTPRRKSASKAKTAAPTEGNSATKKSRSRGGRGRKRKTTVDQQPVADS
jgi:hypothetical protein